MARMFKVQARGTTLLVECASFFNRYRPLEKSESFTLAADAVESIEVVEVSQAVRWSEPEVVAVVSAPAALVAPDAASAAVTTDDRGGGDLPEQGSA
jgi:hypothetical protein